MRTRRRGDALESAILAAAWAELQAVGYDDLTMEGVAERAGTSKAVLYRRWPGRAPLLLAAFRRVVTPVAESLPDTGSLRGDLIAMLGILRDHLQVIQEAAPGAVYGFFRELDALTAEIEFLAPSTIPRILERAEARGEIAFDRPVPPRVLRLPLDLHRHEILLNGGRPLSDDDIAEIVDLIVLPVLTSLSHPG